MRSMGLARNKSVRRPHRITLRLSTCELDELHKTQVYMGLEGSSLLRMLIRKAFHETQISPKELTHEKEDEDGAT